MDSESFGWKELLRFAFPPDDIRAEWTHPSLFAYPDPSEPYEAFFLSKTTWIGITADELRIYGSALYAFTDKGFVFFLPAFLYAATDDSDALDVSLDILIKQLADRPSSISWTLSSTQRLAIVAFLVDAASTQIEGHADAKSHFDQRHGLIAKLGGKLSDRINVSELSNIERAINKVTSR